MPSLTTEGLILKRINFGEADRVLTVLTDRFGKISVIARGVRKITSRRAGNIELLNRVKLHLFKSKNYILQEAQSIETFSKLKENLTLSTTAFHIIELIDRLVPEEQKNPKVYELTLAILSLLVKNPRQIFIRAFEAKLLSMLGFATFQMDTSEVSTQIHLGGVHRGVHTKVKDLLKKLEYGNWEEIGKLDINQKEAVALEQVMRYYLERTLESSLKSVQVLKKLK